MRTVAELRRASNLPIPMKKDSAYTDIERFERKFNPLHVPKTILKNLPFASKPKLQEVKKRKSYEERRCERVPYDRLFFVY